MSVKTRVRHVIEVRVSGRLDPYEFEFRSRDVGCTQGSTVSHQGRLLAAYFPGTRHWETALEATEQLLAAAFQAARPDDWYAFTAAFQQALEADRCRPWDGQDIEAGEDEW